VRVRTGVGIGAVVAAVLIALPAPGWAAAPAAPGTQAPAAAPAVRAAEPGQAASIVSATPPRFTRLPVLKRGMVGHAVFIVQKRLGVSPPEWRFDLATKQAVKRLQVKRGLPATGVVDARTWAAMDVGSARKLTWLVGAHASGVAPAAPAPAAPAPGAPAPAAPAAAAPAPRVRFPVLRTGDRGPGVRLVQSRLGVTPRSGLFGPLTERAVRTHQARSRLPVSGLVNAKTWQSLGYRTAADLPPGVAPSAPPEPVPAPAPVLPAPEAPAPEAPAPGDPGIVPAEPELPEPGPPTPAPVPPTGPVMDWPFPIPRPVPGTAPVPVVALPPETDLAAELQGQQECTPVAKRGTAALRDLILRTYGPATMWIPRGCSVGGQSEHKEGRALDWMRNRNDPEQNRQVLHFLEWLTMPGADGQPAANARRLGVMYLLWDDRIWRAYDQGRGWAELRTCLTDPARRAARYNTDCHRDHLHISLSWEGGAGLTSFWTGAARTMAPCLAEPIVGRGEPPPATEAWTSVEPVRILDTARGIGTPGAQPCRLGGPRWSGDARHLTVQARARGPVPDTAGAVRVRITASAATHATGLRVWPTGRPRPGAATANTSADAPIQMEAVVPVGADGFIHVGLGGGYADVIVEIVAWAPRA